MPAHRRAPSLLTSGLRSLGESQLQTQASRSASLDTAALGMMALDAALATILDGIGAPGPLRIATLALICLSFAMAARTLRLPGAEETGPSLADMQAARETQDEEQLEETLLEGLTKAVEINKRELAHKDASFEAALALLVLTAIVELIGGLS